MLLLRRFAHFALAGMLLLPAGCVNPFKPASPEGAGSGGVAEIFDSPDDVLDTMARAIESKSEAGTNAWLHALADSYQQFYDIDVRRDWKKANSQDGPDPWTLNDERKLPSLLFRFKATANYALAWDPDPAFNDHLPDAADTAQFHRKYTITADDQSTKSVIAIGYADLSFQLVNGKWSITAWNDRVDPTVGVNPSSDARTMSWWRLESTIR